MADTTLVNGQITDAVTQSNLEILGSSPAQAMATLYLNVGHAIGLSIQNATLSQQQFYPLNSSLAAQGVNLLFNVGPAASVVGAQRLLAGNSLAQQLAQLQALLSTGEQMSSVALSSPVLPPPPPTGSPSMIPGEGGPWSG